MSVRQSFTHTTDLIYSKITLVAQSRYIFLHLAPRLLIFIGQFYDTGCETWKNASNIIVTYKRKTTLNFGMCKLLMLNISTICQKRIP